MQLVPWADDLLNRGKRSIAVDLAKSGGAETVLSLVEHADILFEGFRPGVAERLGIGPEPCLLRRPQLVYGRMTGWGQDGPIAHTAGHDITYIAPTGALHAIGQAGGPPQIPLNLVGDFAGGSLYLLVGMLAALDEARRSGRGQVVDAAIVDGSAHLMTMIYSCYAAGIWSDERGTNLGDGGSPFYGVYQDVRCKVHGRRRARAAVLRRVPAPARTSVGYRRAVRPRRVAAAAAKDQGRIRRSPATGLGKDIGGSDACVAPVLGMADAPGHPQLAARNTFFVGNGITQPSPAPRFSRTPAAVDSPPCVPGQHTDEVLADWLRQ